MATDTYWQLEKEYHCLSGCFNLIIRIVEHENVTHVEGHGDDARTVIEAKPCKVSEFKVLRDVVAKASTYFDKLLNSDEHHENTVVVVHEEGSAQGLSVWLKLIHAIEVNVTAVSTKEIWEMLAAANKYGINTTFPEAEEWFGTWYTTTQDARKDKSFGYMDFQELLLPCYLFNYAAGFAQATKFLAYRSRGEIFERRPSGFNSDNLKLDPEIMRQLNSAKTRLRTVLHRKLYDPIDCLLRSEPCPCRTNVLFAYEQCLVQTGAWPFDTAFFNQSIDEVVEKLNGFPGRETILPRTCGNCAASFNLATIVDVAKAECRSCFDGLCLDCMRSSQAQDSSAKESYWQRRKSNVHWDAGCRVRHWQPTWYFSFLGPREEIYQLFRAAGANHYHEKRSSPKKAG